MAILTRLQIQTLIDAYTAKTLLYITSNNNKNITGAQLKEILDDNGVLLEDLKDSYYNLSDDLANAVNYIPLTLTDWDVPTPVQVYEALNQLATRVKIVEAKSFYRETHYIASTDDTVSGSIPIIGVVLANTLTQTVSPTTNFSNTAPITPTWGYRTDGGRNWTEGLSFSALNTALVGINTIPTSRTEVRATMEATTVLPTWEGQLTVTLKNTNA